MKNSFDKFTNNFIRSLKNAAILAIELNHKTIDPDHLLYGLASQRGSVGAEIFTALKVKPTDIKNSVAKFRNSQSLDANKNQPKFSSQAIEIIQKAVQIAYQNKHCYIGTEHLLAGLVGAKNENIKTIFQLTQLQEKELNKQITSVLRSASKLPDITKTFKVINKQKKEYKDFGFDDGFEDQDGLEEFATDLTSQELQQKIDPVIGRNKELERIIQILSRRSKNNPILLGDPGVGKTAICEGLAKKITEGNVPDILKNKKIYSLDLAGMLAGTMYRGEFESRIKKVIEEVKSRDDIILFIDEIHNIVGAGSSSGSLDAANILKPALARGDLRCIGATTYNDYRKYIENDPALGRRFQPVKVEEPDSQSAKEIIYGIKKYFENFHKVEIKDSAIDAAVDLSQKYITDKFLPDKAIDIVDEAASLAKVQRKPSKTEQEIKNLNERLAEIKKQKEKAVLDENYEKAMYLKNLEATSLKRLEEIKTEQKTLSDIYHEKITEADICKILTKMTGIPADDLKNTEKKKILDLEKRLNQKVIGQTSATNKVAEIIKRSKAGLRQDSRPLASFVFAGPSGVGKTYLAKIISEELFGGQDKIIKIDMSEYGEKFNVSKLIGAPAGYVGYKESGQLTEKIKRNPYSVVLFDEIEKANPDIFDLLLQVLDEGYLTDATGNKIDFQNTIIVMTTNLGSHLVGDKKSTLGFDNYEAENNLNQKIIKETKRHFKTEFLNRLDKIICFNPLETNDLQKIAKLEIEKLLSRLNKKGIGFDYDRNSLKLIAKNCSPEQGAREVTKIIEQMIENPLAEKILMEEINSGQTVQVEEKNGIINLRVHPVK